MHEGPAAQLVIFFSPTKLSSLGTNVEETESWTDAGSRHHWAALAEGQRNKLQDKVNCKRVSEVRQWGFSGGKQKEAEVRGSRRKCRESSRIALDQSTVTARGCGVVVKSTDLEDTQPRSESQLRHILSPCL